MFWKFNPLSLASLASILSHSEVTSLLQPREARSLWPQGWSLPVAPEVVTWVGWQGLNPRASPTQQMPSGLPDRGLLDGRVRPAAFPVCPQTAGKALRQYRTGFQIKALCSIGDS